MYLAVCLAPSDLSDCIRRCFQAETRYWESWRGSLRNGSLVVDNLSWSLDLVLLRTVGSGLSNEEIGQRLEIAAATARNRVSRLRARLGITSRRRLVAYAAARGLLWIEPEDGVDTVGP